MTAKAAFTDSKEGVVAYFLPRNVDGIALGQIAVASGIEHDKYELEQNVVNGKVKTVTAQMDSSNRQQPFNSSLWGVNTVPRVPNGYYLVRRMPNDHNRRGEQNDCLLSSRHTERIKNTHGQDDMVRYNSA
eukprot:scaffold44750_cov47-Cyclotella_meneghiniana.AAC.2